MNLRMLKYPLFDVLQACFDEEVSIVAPPSTGINHIAMQRGVVTLWSLVDMDIQPIDRRFYIAGTGHGLPKSPCYLGTVHERVFVWHIFELFEARA